jgi:hypothetical protein
MSFFHVGILLLSICAVPNPSTNLDELWSNFGTSSIASIILNIYILLSSFTYIYSLLIIGTLAFWFQLFPRVAIINIKFRFVLISRCRSQGADNNFKLHWCFNTVKGKWDAPRNNININNSHKHLLFNVSRYVFDILVWIYVPPIIIKWPVTSTERSLSRDANNSLIHIIQSFIEPRVVLPNSQEPWLIWAQPIKIRQSVWNLVPWGEKVLVVRWIRNWRTTPYHLPSTAY